MSLSSVPDNERMAWSCITDGRILRPGDELRLIGSRFLATIGVLDSHDPSTARRRRFASRPGVMALPPLPSHHHVLLRVEGKTPVMSAGLYANQEQGPGSLLFPHVTRGQTNEAYISRLCNLVEALSQGAIGLYYVSAAESLSQTPEGQAYLDPMGKLRLD